MPPLLSAGLCPVHQAHAQGEQLDGQRDGHLSGGGQEAYTGMGTRCFSGGEQLDVQPNLKDFPSRDGTDFSTPLKRRRKKKKAILALLI